MRKRRTYNIPEGNYTSEQVQQIMKFKDGYMAECIGYGALAGSIGGGIAGGFIAALGSGGLGTMAGVKWGASIGGATGALFGKLYYESNINGKIIDFIQSQGWR